MAAVKPISSCEGDGFLKRCNRIRKQDGCVDKGIEWLDQK